MNRNSSSRLFHKIVTGLSALGVLASTLGLPKSAQASSAAYVLDNFTTAVYTRQDGNTYWSTNWIETNDDGAAATGGVLINGGQLRLNNITTTATLESIERELNMPINATATLIYDYTTSTTLDGSDILIVDIFDADTSTWTTLNTYTDDVTGTATVDITNYRSANTRIRFRVAGAPATSYVTAGQYFAADNVRVNYWSPSTHTPVSVFQTVQTYYIPVPEDQSLLMLDTVNALANDPMYLYVSITVDADGTVIYYDHWEDDFETKVTDPQQNTSEIWGDNNTANGIPPGFATDILNAGNIIILNNTVPSTNLSLIDFDGGDKISSSNAIAVTRTSWASGSGTLHGGAVEMLDTSIWGTRFDVPADSGDSADGVDTDTEGDDFEYGGITVMASEDNTQISLNGVYTATINEGQSYLFNDNVAGGDQITSSAPVQANFLTGNIGSNYESSWYTLYPFDLLSSDYYAPVDRNGGLVTAVYLQNPNASSITVHWTIGGTAQADQVIAAGATARVTMTAAGYGARFYTGTGSGSDPVFQAISTIDSAAQSSDWGYTLIPGNQLTQQAQVGWGVGQDPTITPATENGSPVWVMAVGVSPMYVCVDEDGEGTTGTLDASTGSYYDQRLTLNNLQRAYVYDTLPDRDQTGMLLFLCNGSESANSKNNKIAVAWGQRPGDATAGAPGLDVGTSVPPLPNFTAVKNAVLTTDVNGDGKFDIGDTFEYQIKINNVGALPIPAGTITVSDIIPANTTYVVNTTYIDATSIPDAGSGTPFPLDAGGYLIPTTLPIDGVFIVKFRVTIGAGATNIINDANVSGLDLSYLPKVEIFIGTPSKIGDFIWLDIDGDGVQDAGEPGIAGVTVELSNGVCTIGSSCPTTVTNTSGAYLFDYLSSGTYTVIVRSSTLPGNVSQTGDPDSTFDNQHTVTVASGTNYLTADFGYRNNTSVIGNSVWLDEDGNGYQDAGEAGISNVTVQLWNSGHTTLLQTTTTDVNGNYIFKNVSPATTYQVDVLGTTLPTGLVQTTVIGGSADSTNKADPYTLTTVAGSKSMQADFGYNWAPPADTDGNINTGAIGDRVWIDDGDGVQEPGEPGMYNVSVQLLTPGTDGILGTGDDVVAATTTTGYDGSYIFDGLAAGAYAVRVNGGAAPTNYTQTGDPDLPGTICTTCDNKTTTPIVLAPGDVYVNADFGYTPTAGNGGNIGDTLWLDLDRGSIDGVSGDPDAEPRLAGVTVALIRDLDGDGVWDVGEPIIASDITDVNGAYSFTNLPVTDGAGTDDYLVWVNDTANVLTGLTPVYDNNSAASTPNISKVAGLTTAGNALQDFGYAPIGHDTGEGVIGDTIYLNRDGGAGNDYDAGEGLEGVRVNLYLDVNNNNVWDVGDTLQAFAFTNADGSYYFGGLAVGEYIVKVDTTTLPAGLTNTFDSVDDGAAGGVASESAESLTAGEINLNRDFGYDGGNTVSGTLWRDTDAAGDLDAGETLRFQNITIVLRNSSGNVIATTTTDASGNYSFANLPNGTFTVDVTDDANLLDGYWHSLGSSPGTDSNSQVDPYTVVLSGSTNNTTADFGYYRYPASIGDFVWDDTDGDGIQDVGELGINGATVTLTITWPGGAGTTTLTTTTNASGAYSFGNLLLDEDFDGAGAGEPTFTVTFTTPSNYLPSPADQGGDDGLDSDGLTEPASPVEGGAITNIDSGFIEQIINIGDTLWYDWDGDGTQDANEPGIPNIDVFVDINNNGIYDGGDLLDSTDVNGQYNFLDLALGTYRVIVNTSDPQFPAGVAQTYDLDGTLNNEHTLNGSVAGTYNNVDFGYQGTGSISNYVWNDIDGDGVQDGSESGISGVTVWVDLDNDGTFDATEPSDLTDANGQYYIGGLYENTGGYTVRVDAGVGEPVNGATPTYDLNGTGTPNVATVTITAGQNRTDVDWGYQFAALDITKISDAGGIVTPGDTIEYTITVRNNTASTQTGIAVTDTLPTGTTYISQSTVAAGYTGGVTLTYLDQFEVRAYNNSNGTTTWSSAWTEGGEESADNPGNSATGGYIQVTNNGGGNDELSFDPNGAGGYGGGAYRIERAADLSGIASATLSFTYDEDGNLEAGDTVDVEVWDGSTWQNVLSVNNDFGGPNNFSQDISAWANVNTIIRFTVVGFTDTGENFAIDNVQIQFTTPITAVTKDNIPAGTYTDLSSGVPSTLVVAGDSFGLAPNQEMIVTYSVTVNNPVPGGLTSIDNTASVVSTQQPTAQQAFVSDPLGNATIGDRVWLDEDSDGVQDAGESGIPNVRVFLDTDNDGAYDVGETYVYTDTEGNYIFTGVSPATYNVAVDTITLPGGLTNATYDENNGTTNPNSRTPVTLAAEQEYVTADFGYNWATTTDVTNPGGGATGSIGDRIWIDADGDGVQDPGEAGLSGVTVELITAGVDGIFGTGDDVTAASTSTNAAGSYIFDGLSAGAYVVQVSTPGSYTQTGDPDSTLDNQTTTPILLAPGDVYVNADFGYQLNSGANTIGNQIFVDTNGDGNLDGGEPGIPGVTVALLNNTGTVIATTVTDVNGQYSLPGLPDGTYTVWVNDTANVLGSLVQNSTPNNAVDGGQACGTCNRQNTVTVSGTGNANQDFGFAPSSHGSGGGLIGDTIYLDRDGGNDYDAGEGLEGVTVRLYTDTNADGNYDTGEPLVASTKTDENGNYYFGNLPAGNYVVRVDTTTLPAGVTNTVDVGDATLNEGGLTLAAGGINLAQDFGYDGTNTISGTLWRDTDADGLLEAGETGRFNTVTIVLRNSSGSIFATTTTDSSGNYSFPNLPDGTFTVDVTDGNNVLNGYWHSMGATPGSDNNSQSDPYSVTVTGGQTNTTADFGYYVDPAAIGDRVWLDANSNGIQDSISGTPEPSLPNSKVTLTITYPNSSVVTLTTYTDQNGIYSFGNLLLDENYDGAGAGEPAFSLTFEGYGLTPTSTGAGTASTDSNGATPAATVTEGSTDITYDSGFLGNLDLGDLPVPNYPTLYSPGPAHVVFPDGVDAGTDPDTIGGRPAVWLGLTIDTESNGQPNAAANGDGVDEDGFVLAATGWTAGSSSTATVTINSNQSAVTVYYGVWIDWNTDNTFDAFYNGSGVSGSPVNIPISVSVPGGYVANSNVYMRVRASDSAFTSTDYQNTRVNGEVEDYLYTFTGGGVATPVTLSYFTTKRQGDNVTFNWSTETETGNVGFNIYVEQNKKMVQVNSQLIPSKVVDSLNRQDYSFTASVKGNTFFIEDVSILGEAELHGPYQIGREYGVRLEANKIDLAAIQKENNKEYTESQAALRRGIGILLPDNMVISTAVVQPMVVTPTPTKTPWTGKSTPKPTKTPRPTKTATPTGTFTPTVVFTATVTPTLTETPQPTATSTPVEATVDVTGEPTITSEWTPTPTHTPADEWTPTPTYTPVDEWTSTPTYTSTSDWTATPTHTPTTESTATNTPTSTSTPTPVPTAVTPATSAPVDPANLLLTNTFNLKVRKTGIYRVTYEMLRDGGLDLAGVSVANITVINRDQMVPVNVYSVGQSETFGVGGYIEFYGEALDTIYTDTNIYTIQVSRVPVIRIPGTSAVPQPGAIVPVTFTHTLVVNNQRGFAEYAPGADLWFDTSMFVYTTAKSWSIPFQINTPVDPSKPQILELVVWGVTDFPAAAIDHHLQASINGVPAIDESFNGLVEKTFKAALPAGAIHEGTNTLKLTLPANTGVGWDMINLDKIKATYERSFKAQNGQLIFTALGESFNVTDLPSGNVVVYRMTNNGMERLENISVQIEGSTFSASFAGSTQSATYLVSTVEALQIPLLEATRLAVDIKQPAQYLIITHPNFKNGLLPLVQAKQAQGLTVNVVDVTDIYQQYSYGIFDPQAIKKYIAYAANNLGTQYVLLVGGDTYDYRNYLGLNSISFIPSLYAETSPSVKFAPVDPLYTDLDGNNVPDLAIGRFPVRTDAELGFVINKTLAYAGKNYGQTAVFASDKNDGIVSYKDMNNSLVANLPNGWTTTNIHMDDVSLAVARQQLLAAMNSGSSLVTFTGHSSPSQWSFSNLFNTTDANALTNTGRPFVSVQWGCWNTFYVDPVNNRLVQSLLLSGDKGAAAVFGAVALTDSRSEDMLSQLLMPRLTTAGMPMGKALQDAKTDLAKTNPGLLDVLLGWSLMGDPALVIQP